VRREFLVRCGVCGAEIEACDGYYGDWLHTGTRREHCATGRTLAVPEPPSAQQERAS
jgi:hypothetical protein